MKNWILIGLFLAIHGQTADFFSMYDFAYNYPNDEPFDLLGNGPKLKKIDQIERKEVQYSPKGWKAEAMKDIDVSLPTNCSSFSIITAVSFPALQAANVFLSIGQKSNSLMCGIKCLGVKNSLILLSPYCKDKSQIVEGRYFSISSTTAISFALSFSPSAQGMDFVVYVYPSGDVIHEYKITASFINFYIFNLLLSMNMNGPGEVHYVGLTSHSLTMHEFRELVKNSRVHLQEISCPNCEGNTKELHCSEGSNLIVGKNARSYFCKCPPSYGFMDSSSKCEKIEFGQQNSYCPKGYSNISKSHCFEKCQNSHISDYDGEFVTCSQFENRFEKRTRYSKRINQHNSPSDSENFAEEEENYRENTNFTIKQDNNSIVKKTRRTLESSSSGADIGEVFVTVLAVVGGIFGCIVVGYVCNSCGCDKARDQFCNTCCNMTEHSDMIKIACFYCYLPCALSHYFCMCKNCLCPNNQVHPEN